MNIQRIAAIYVKDAQWAVKNMKLMVLMMAPAILSLGMARFKTDALFTYSVFFMMSFVGLFLTSYIITEEKRIGTLKALLVTPLTATELIIGKFLFPLSICILFAILNFSLQGQMAILMKPAVFITLVLASGAVCSIGNLFGLFFKNEQELGIVAPFAFLAFIAGSLVAKGSKSHLHGYFPDFHLSGLIENYSHLDRAQILGHMAFQTVLFGILLAMTVQYVRYFFSKDTEGGRINIKTLLYIPAILAFVIISGRTAKYFEIHTQNKDSLNRFQIQSQQFSKDLVYSQDEFTIQPLTALAGKVKDLNLKSTNPGIADLTISVKEESKGPNETPEFAKKAIFVMGKNEAIEGLPDYKLVLAANPIFYTTGFKKTCNGEILTLNFKHPTTPKDYRPTFEKAVQILKDSNFTCTTRTPAPNGTTTSSSPSSPSASQTNPTPAPAGTAALPAPSATTSLESKN